MNGRTENERESYYDWLRMIATSYVVFGHSLYLGHKTIYGGVDYSQLDSAQVVYDLYYRCGLGRIVLWIYTFHMPLFFLLSGAVLALKPLGSYSSFLVKKARRLWIPYLCVGYLFMLPIKYISGFYDAAGLKQAALGLWKCVESGHLWFLPALFWDMMIFVTIYKVLQKIHMQKAMLLIALVMQCTCQWIPKDILGAVSGLEMIFWFVLGFEFAQKRECLKKYPLSFWFVLLGMGIVSDIIISQYSAIPAYVLVIIRCFETCVLAQIADICLCRVTNTRFYRSLTMHLFDIYLYHDPLEYLVLFCFFRLDIVSRPGGGCLLILTRFFGVIALSVVLGCGMESAKRRVRKL